MNLLCFCVLASSFTSKWTRRRFRFALAARSLSLSLPLHCSLEPTRKRALEKESAASLLSANRQKVLCPEVRQNLTGGYLMVKRTNERAWEQIAVSASYATIPLIAGSNWAAPKEKRDHSSEVFLLNTNSYPLFPKIPAWMGLRLIAKYSR